MAETLDPENAWRHRIARERLADRGARLSGGHANVKQDHVASIF
ncbi:MAG: hypothetical protein ACRDFS_10835 [Chloroflexota bacterium]